MESNKNSLTDFFDNKGYFYRYLRLSGDNIFFWSDLHLGHNKPFLYGNRGFATVEDHDKYIVEKWNETLNNDSTIFLLGDTIFGHNAEQRLKEFFDAVNFSNVVLLAGNHNAGYKQLFTENYQPSDTNKSIFYCPPYLETIINKQAIILSHYPIASWNGQKDSYHIHGHCHSNLTIDLGRAIDVGIENYKEPLNIDDALVELKSRTRILFDHHDDQTNNPL